MTYSTTDLGFAAFLIATKVAKFTGAKVEDSTGTVGFQFESKSVEPHFFDRLEDDYFRNGAEVPARDYFNALRETKSLIYATQRKKSSQ